MNAAFESPILVVTTDPAFVTRILRDFTRARILNIVDVVETDAGALAYLMKCRPALFVLDQLRPGLCREDAGKTPILVVAAASDPKLAYLRVLPPPLDPGRLLEALQELGVDRLLRP